MFNLSNNLGVIIFLWADYGWIARLMVAFLQASQSAAPILVAVSILNSNILCRIFYINVPLIANPIGKQEKR